MFFPQWYIHEYVCMYIYIYICKLPFYQITLSYYHISPFYTGSSCLETPNHPPAVTAASAPLGAAGRVLACPACPARRLELALLKTGSIPRVLASFVPSVGDWSPVSPLNKSAASWSSWKSLEIHPRQLPCVTTQSPCVQWLLNPSSIPLNPGLFRDSSNIWMIKWCPIYLR